MNEIKQTEVEFVEVDGGVRVLDCRRVNEVVVGVGVGGEAEITTRVGGELAQ